MQRDQRDQRDQLDQRLALIERLIAEGRRDTEYWGWAFVLWGAGHLVAVLGHRAGFALAWPVAMAVCGVVMGVGAGLRARRPGRKTTTLGRALGAVWLSLGVAMAVAGFVGGFTGFLSGPAILVAFFLLMGAASFASGLMLRWLPWAGLGLLWWSAATVSMVTASPAVATWSLIAMAVVGELGLGVALMILEQREARGVRQAARS